MSAYDLLSTLYVMTQGALVRLDHDSLRVKVDGAQALQMPIRQLESLVVFGRVTVTTGLLHRCAQEGIPVVFLDRRGRFRARTVGPVSGNVLLRKAQYSQAEDIVEAAEIARRVVAAKVQNCRHVLLRSARDSSNPQEATELRGSAKHLGGVLPRIQGAGSLDELRGMEGEAAQEYFRCFNTMIVQQRETFRVNGRNRRPPRDPVNAMLSFLYTLLLGDCTGAAEAVGLDPQVGFLHSIRPGRPSLALDLMEELRPVLADRVALTLINRCEVGVNSFDEHPGGAVYLNEAGRRTVVAGYQKRRQRQIRHRLLRHPIPFGLVLHLQARLLARTIRGDTAYYPAFVYR